MNGKLRMWSETCRLKPAAMLVGCQSEQVIQWDPAAAIKHMSSPKNNCNNERASMKTNSQHKPHQSAQTQRWDEEYACPVRIFTFILYSQVSFHLLHLSFSVL